MQGALKEGRLAAGFTQEQLAVALKAAVLAGGEDWGPSTAGDLRSEISRWERGKSEPHPRWRPYLRAVLGDDGNIPTVDGEITRRELFAGMVGVAALAASGAAARSLGSLARSALNPKGPIRPETVVDYQTRVLAVAKSYWTRDAEWVEADAVNLMAEGVAYLPRAGGRQVDIAVAAALAALTAGRVAFFDQRNEGAGRGHLATAADLAQAGGDQSLLAAVLAHRAFMPGLGGNPDEANVWLRRADVTAPRRGQPMLRSWLHCVRAELAAAAGDHRTAAEQIRRAGEGVHRSGEAPEWLDWYDSARLDAFAGGVTLAAGKHEAAVARLATAAAAIADPKQRAVVTFDLALAYGHEAPELALGCATEAFTLMRDRPYLTALDRLPALDAALAGTKQARELREWARELLPVG